MLRFDERLRLPTWIGAIVLAGVLASCGGPSGTPDTTPPTVTGTTPIDGSVAPTNQPVTATFDEAIDVATLTTSSFTLTTDPAGTIVDGSVSFHAATDTATFTPTLSLAVSTAYTATLSTAITDLAGNALEGPVTWTFTTQDVAAESAGAVELGSAADFVLLAKSGITTTGVTAITGDIGVSPVDLTYVTGFDTTLDASGTFATSDLVTGNIYAANLTEPTPTLLTAAVGAMETAYTDAAGRTTPDATELAAGLIGGLNLAPGLYTWGTAVEINTNLTLTGSATDVWVMQISQDLTLASGIKVELAGGALPENVFWQVAGRTQLGTTSVLNGIVLSQTAVIMETGATLNGRAFAQTNITLDAVSVTQP